ncbi:RHS repeat protein [Cronobacter sakazakii]|nr:RHS repeat domain-containing protein [Cronobacter sakazakii]MDK1263230.1 RHS repeat protein [Cronobacter sakazakii]
MYAFPVQEVLPDGATWQYEYNPRGDVVSLTDPNTATTRCRWKSAAPRALNGGRRCWKSGSLRGTPYSSSPATPRASW